MNINLAPLDYLKDQSVHVCIACRAGVSVGTFQSFKKWNELAMQMGIASTASAIDEGATARNILTSGFMNSPGTTHMLLIDGDVLFEPFHILALLSSKKHIIGSGGYHSDIMASEGDIEEVGRINNGFMLVSREALIHLQDHEKIVQIGEDPFLRTYFDTGVRNGTYCEEEWEFTQRWQDIGGHVWSHKLVQPVRP